MPTPNLRPVLPAGRPFNSTTTRLGRVMKLRGHTNVYELAGKVGISPRRMSDYLAGRREIKMEHLVILAKELDVPDPMLLREEVK